MLLRTNLAVIVFIWVCQYLTKCDAKTDAICDDAVGPIEKRRCSCFECGYLYYLTELCRAPRVNCHESKYQQEAVEDTKDYKDILECKAKMPMGGSKGYCAVKLMSDYDDDYGDNEIENVCCRFSDTKYYAMIAVIVVDIILFNWWFNKCDTFLNCVIPTCKNIFIGIMKELKTYILDRTRRRRGMDDE